MFHSLRFRLLVVLILIVVAAVGIMAFFSTLVTTRMFARYQEHGGMIRHRRFEVLLAEHYAQNESWASVQSEVERMGQITGERVILADEEGKIVADSAGELIGQPVGQDWAALPPLPIIYHGAKVGILYADLPGWGAGPEREVFLAPVNRTLLLIAVVAGLGAVLLIVGLSRRILAPVEALTAAVRRMEAGDLSQRVEITSQDEIGELARAFNSMADGLVRLEELRRNMVTDVAHELRTPLSNIRGYLEALQDGVVEPDRHIIDSLYEEAMLLNRLVNDLQELSLAEAGQLKLECRPVALADVVNRAVEAVRARAEDKGIELQVDLPEDLPLVDIDPQRIGQVLRNLLDNALTHTPPGGEIAIAASVHPSLKGRGRGRVGLRQTRGFATDPGDTQFATSTPTPTLPLRGGGGERILALDQNRWVAVSVRDAGSGIAAEDLPHVFERFYRSDKSRSRDTGGAGLGLAIARQLVQAHGGQIEVESRGEPSWSSITEGTRFTFTLPVAGP